MGTFITRWSRPIGVSLSLVLVAVLLVVALRSDYSDESELPPPGAPPDIRNGRVFIQDNLWSTRTHQYAVWVGTDGTPYAAKRRRGSSRWRKVNLAKVQGNPLDAPTVEDNHNVYAIATDADGAVHIVGNMQNDPLRYVRSPRGDLDTWGSEPAPAGGAVSYPAFVGLPDGTLLFWRREGPAGDDAVMVDAVDPGTAKWRSLGAVLDGRPSGEGPYLHHIAVDPGSGAIHLLFEWRTNEDVATNHDVGYARSTDGGRTWETSDGTPLPVPITRASAETVIDTPPRGSGLFNQGGLTVDSQGRPHGVVTFQQPGAGRSVEHVWLDEAGWQREQLDDLYLDGRPKIVGMPDGRVWLLGVRGETLEAVDVTPDRDRLPARDVAAVPVGWEPNYDSQALARHGVVEMLIPDGDRPRVVEVELAED